MLAASPRGSHSTPLLWSPSEPAWHGLGWAGLGWTRKVKCVAQSRRGWRMGGWGDSAICGLGILLTWNFIVFTCIFPNTKQNSWVKSLSSRANSIRSLLTGNLFWAFYADFWLATLFGQKWAFSHLEAVGHHIFRMHIFAADTPVALWPRPRVVRMWRCAGIQR